MKIYSAKGVVYETSDYEFTEETFYIQKLQNDCVEEYRYPGDGLRYDLDGELVELYDTLRDLYFDDINQYYKDLNIMPIFVQSAGQSSDCALSAKLFAEFICSKEYNQLPNFYRYLYLVDCQYLVGTIQNLLSGMDDILATYFVRIGEITGNHYLEDRDTIIYTMSPKVSNISSLLESYFTKAYSILDMLTRLAYEIEFPMTDFSKYNKLKCANLLWGARKKLSINGTRDTVFEKCTLIEMIESLRNEVVHNGAWELNPKLFIKYKNGKIVERFMLFPDIEQEHLAVVKNRKHFFASNNKVNDSLPEIHFEFQRRVMETVKCLNTYND